VCGDNSMEKDSTKAKDGTQAKIDGGSPDRVSPTDRPPNSLPTINPNRIPMVRHR